MKGSHALLLNALWLVGCGFTPRLIGARWGERPAVVAARLGSSCKELQTWGQSGFEACTADSAAPIKVLGGAADMTLVRRGDELEAVMLSFRECSTQREALTAAVRRELATAPDDGMDPYQVSRRALSTQSCAKL